MSFDKNDSYRLILYSSIHLIHFQQKRFWVSNNILTLISVTSNHMSFQRTFCVKLMEQACMSANERFWSEIKRSIKQLLSRGRIFNDHLRNFNTENSVWIQFILYGSNKITREIFSRECFTEVATFLKSYWKHCQYTKFCSVFSLPRICSA